MNLQCPQCNSPISPDGQRFCNRCGNDLRAYYQSAGIHIPETAPENIDPPGNEVETLDVSPANNSPAVNDPPYKETIAIQVPEITLETPSNNTSKQSAILRIVLPSSDVYDREIKKAETQIGKGPRNDIVIADPAVSTSHAVIKNHNGDYIISDIGSRNGTLINGNKISEPHKLNHGDVIGMGVTKLTFRLSGYSETGVIEMPETTAAMPNVPLPLTQEALASVLITEGVVSRTEIDRVRGKDARGRRLVRALVEDKLVNEEQLRDLMSRIFQIQPINLRDTKVDEAFAAKFSPKLVRESWIFPVTETQWQLTLAVADPTDIAAIEEFRRKTTLQIQTRLATLGEINEKIDLHFGPRLVGVLPTGEKLEYPMIRKEVEIGKAPHNHIVLSDQTVSNTHAIIMVRDGGYMIVDLGSRNGTFVDGERLGTQPHTLKHGDSIQMGQTVLTYRNPSETPDNVTAILSPEIVEEMRRRAESNITERQMLDANQVGGSAFAPVGNVIITHTPPADLPIAQPLVSPPPVVAPDTDEAAEGGKKKKKKDNKEKEQERIKAAYIGALGRILAAILSVVLTVVLAIYINNSMKGGGSSPHEKPVIETSSKGKAKLKVATPGAGTAFTDGVYEASSVTQVPNSEGVYFVADNKPDEIFWLPLDGNGKQAGPIKPINIGATIADPEGITYSGSFFYLIGSNSHPEAGERNALARFAFDSSTQTIQGQTDVMSNLREFLIDNVPELKSVANLQGNAGGINIEGIAWDAIHDRLYLGLRSPVVSGKALVVPIKLKDPRGPFTTQNLTVPESPIHLSLNGLGVRDIQYDSRLGVFMIVAGPSGSGGGTDVILYEWNGDTDFSKPESAPREITKLDSVMKPEGVTRAKIGGHDFIFIVGDGSSYMKLDFQEGQ
jgi:pSer/pThr/pTyr-binding forkhead associated (FHA) protein